VKARQRQRLAAEGRPRPVNPGRGRVPAAADSGDRPGGAKPAYGKACLFANRLRKTRLTATLPCYKPSLGQAPTFGPRPRAGRWRPARPFADRSGDRPSFGPVSRRLVAKPAFGGRPSYGATPFGDRPSFGEAFLRWTGRPWWQAIVLRPASLLFDRPRPGAGAPPHLAWSGPGTGTSSGAKR